MSGLGRVEMSGSRYVTGHVAASQRGDHGHLFDVVLEPLCEGLVEVPSGLLSTIPGARC